VVAPVSRVRSTSLAAAVILALAAAGCGGSDLASQSATSSTTSTTTSTTDTGGTVRVVMRSLDFNPTSVKARVGQRVIWTNDDATAHNVTYVSGPRFRSSRRLLGPGARFSFNLTEAGTIHYVCTLHPWMKATIVVAPS
jgi:plastocyanin